MHSDESENNENNNSEGIPDNIEIAYHEAGHAVMHFLNKLPIKKVTIIPDEESLGRVLSSPTYHKEFNVKTLSDKYVESEIEHFSDNRIMKEIMDNLAGDVAINILTNKPGKGTSSDFSNTYTLAFYNCGSKEEAEALVNYLWLRTYNMLKIDFNWILVETLAKELLEKKEIGGRKVKKILKDTQVNFFSKIANVDYIN